MIINGQMYELRLSKYQDILQVLKSATIVPEGMQPRTETGTKYQPIDQPKKNAPPVKEQKPLTPAQKAAQTRAKNKAEKEASNQ